MLENICRSFYVSLTILFLGAPLLVFSAPGTFKQLVEENFIGLFNNAVIPLIFALAFITFLWGVFQYMFFPENKERLEQGKSMIVFGLIGLFVMVVVWGLVNIVSRTFFG